jgi:hypothetical protein
VLRRDLTWDGAERTLRNREEEQEGLEMEMVLPPKGKLALQATLLWLCTGRAPPADDDLPSGRTEAREEEAAAAIAMNRGGG